MLRSKAGFLIPLDHIRGVRRDPEYAARSWKGWRLCGTGFPDVISAGWYYKEGRHVFWDVVNPQNAVTINLADEAYSELIVEVADPDAAVSLIRDATANFSR